MWGMIHCFGSLSMLTVRSAYCTDLVHVDVQPAVTKMELQDDVVYESVEI